ncbi:MAG: hypothetical protein ABIG11_04430 [bacterium]
MRFLTLFLLCHVFPFYLHALESGKTSGFSFNTHVVNRRVWRGREYGGNFPHVQPSIEYSFGNAGLAVGAFASHAIHPSSIGEGADFYISCVPWDSVVMTFVDYYFLSDGVGNNFFNYSRNETKHIIEGMIRYNGTENFPATLLFAMNVHGADGTRPNGDPYYAKYLEAGYPISFTAVDIRIFLGAALDNPEREDGWVGYYGGSGGVINLGFTLSRKIKISETYSIPVNSSLIHNPETKKVYLVFCLSF